MVVEDGMVGIQILKVFQLAVPPKTLDWDTWLMSYPYHEYHKDYIDGQWRCWYDFGNGALGDWGAHLMDGFHQFLNLGLPTKIEPTKIVGHNNFFYPQSSIKIQFSKKRNYAKS